MSARLLLLHETGTSGAVWDRLAAAVPAQVDVLAPERFGWGDSEAEELPEDYRATTVDEQAERAAELLAAGEAPAIVGGAGIGAAVALDLLIARPELVRGALLIEPPLLAFVPEATEVISADRVALGDAVNSGGIGAGADLYLSGAMEGLGPGAGRLPGDLAAPGRERPRSLFAELAAVPGWNLPFAALRSVESPSRIVVSAGTPPFLRAAADQLAARLAGSELVDLPGEGPAHVDAVEELARAVAALSDA